MRKTVYTLSLFLILGLTSSFPEIKKKEFLPEVKALFEAKPLDRSLLDRNLFVFYNGFRFPHDNYAQISATIISNNYKKGLEGIEHTNNEAIGQIEYISDYLDKDEKLLNIVYLEDESGRRRDYKDYFPCVSYLNSQCIKETVDNKAIIYELREKNHLLLTRYTKLLEQVDHNSYIAPYIHPWSIGLPFYQDFVMLSNLQLAEAILQLNEGNFEKGLTVLEYERAMIELNLSPNSNLTLIDAMIMIVRMQNFDQALNAILEGGFFDSELKNQRVDHLFSPYTKAERQATFRAYKSEAFLILSPFFGKRLKNSGSNTAQFMLDDKDKILALVRLKSLDDDFPQYHLPKRLEALLAKKEGHQEIRFDKEMETFLEEIAQEEEEPWFGLSNDIKKRIEAKLEPYFSKKGISLINIVDYFNDDSMVEFYNELYQSNQQYLTLLEHEPFSETTKKFIESMKAKYEDIPYPVDYLARMAAQSNYHHLVYLKYRIERDKIIDADIPNFLASMGELAKDPLTQAPYQWDAKDRTLSLLLPEMKYQTSNIRNNEKATHFKVWIRD